MEYQERNRKSLLDALAKMKGFDPPAGLWDAIQDNMNGDEQKGFSIENLADVLPKYTPPVTVWNELSKELDQQKDRKGLKTAWRKRLAWAGGIAASVAILVAAGLIISSEEAPRITKTYAQETMQQFDIEIDWTADQDIFDRIKTEISQVDEPAINNLRTELEELTAAKTEVQEMVNAYGKDPQLIRQLADIERIRSGIYRQIIALI